MNKRFLAFQIGGAWGVTLFMIALAIIARQGWGAAPAIATGYALPAGLVLAGVFITGDALACWVAWWTGHGGWKTVRDTGIHRYQQHTTTGHRRVIELRPSPLNGAGRARVCQAWLDGGSFYTTPIPPGGEGFSLERHQFGMAYTSSRLGKTQILYPVCVKAQGSFPTMGDYCECADLEGRKYLPAQWLSDLRRATEFDMAMVAG